jgi:uncharacterized CHY-type Zn-finger protein
MKVVKSWDNLCKTRHSKGYTLVKVPCHPYSNHSGYVPEHRLVIEEKIGRFIVPDQEDAHHVDGNITNNDPCNLMLITKSEHRRMHSGWKVINGKWWKTCNHCQRFLEVEPNFYKRHTGHNEYMTFCKDCQREITSIKRGINTFCSWCRKPLGNNKEITGDKVSHGMCKACAKNWGK